MELPSASPRPHRLIKPIGWIVSIIGMGLWLYGYFAEGGASVIDWPQYIPAWAADFVPNWQAELGFAISLIGMIPLYYVEYLEFKAGSPSGGCDPADMVAQKAVAKRTDSPPRR